MESLTGIILAGGQSRRMGMPKGLFLINGKPMIRYVFEAIKPFCNEVLVVANTGDYDFLKLPVFNDIIKGKGPLTGIYTGLHFSGSSANLFMPCDMPFISAAVIEHLLENAENSEIVIPELKSKWFPLCGIYHKNIKGIFYQKLAENELSVKKVISSIGCLTVAFSSQFEQSFKNINAPEEFYPNLKTMVI